MPENVWGSWIAPANYVTKAVGMNTECPKTGFLKILSEKKDVNLDLLQYAQFTSGDMSMLKSTIETGVSGSQVQFLRVSWDSEEVLTTPVFDAFGNLTGWTQIRSIKGFQVQAIVKNVNAGMTGMEIAALIGAIAFLAVVIVLIVIMVYAVWTILDPNTSPAQKIQSYLILIVVVVILLLLFGVGFKVKLGKGKEFQIGKGKK